MLVGQRESLHETKNSKVSQVNLRRRLIESLRLAQNRPLSQKGWPRPLRRTAGSRVNLGEERVPGGCTRN